MTLTDLKAYLIICSFYYWSLMVLSLTQSHWWKRIEFLELWLCVCFDPCIGLSHLNDVFIRRTEDLNTKGLRVKVKNILINKWYWNNWALWKTDSKHRHTVDTRITKWIRDQTVKYKTIAILQHSVGKKSRRVWHWLLRHETKGMIHAVTGKLGFMEMKFLLFKKTFNIVKDKLQMRRQYSQNALLMQTTLHHIK